MSRERKKDPWLPHRLDNLARVHAAEKRIEQAAHAMLADWYPAAHAAVMGPWHQLTAAGEGPSTPPNPDNLARAEATLEAAYTAKLAPVLADVFGERFAQVCRDAVISDIRYREAYAARTAMRIKGISHTTREQIRDLVTEAVGKGLSMQAAAKGVDALLTLDGPAPRFTMFAEAAREETDQAVRRLRTLMAVPKDDRDAKWREQLSEVRSLRHKARQDHDAARQAASKPRTRRALTIARTEVMAALNGGTVSAMRARAAAFGEPMEKVWLSTPDERTRETHRDADGQRVGLDLPFDVGGARLDHPGDPDGPADEVINCRCCLLEARPDEDPRNPVTDRTVQASGGTASRPPAPGVSRITPGPTGGTVTAHRRITEFAALQAHRHATAARRRVARSLAAPRFRITEFTAPDAKVPLPYEPAPYTKGPEETVTCQNCGLGDAADAVFCDQCGVKLDEPGGEPYSAGKDETVQCPQDQAMNAADARFCDQDGYKLIGSTDVAPAVTAAAPDAAAADEVPASPAPAGNPALTPFTAILAVEGAPTGDGRQFAADALVWRQLPLPLMFQPQTGDFGHTGSYAVGRIDTISRDGNLIRATGVILPPNPADGDDPIQTLLTLLENGVRVGPSVDLDDMVIEFPEEPMPPEGDDFADDPAPEVMMVTSGRIIAATVVPTPAFAEVAIQLGSEPCNPAATTDPSAGKPAAPKAEAAPSQAAAGAPADPSAPDDTDQADSAPEGAKRSDGTVVAVGDEVLAIVGDGDSQRPVEATVTAADAGAGTVDLQLSDGSTQSGVAVDQVWPDPDGADEDDEGDQGQAPVMASVASTAVLLAAAPVAPPREWFDDPQLSGPTPFTITDDGRVYGHLATWGTCHTGFADTCVTPPRETDYSYFHVGEVLTREGVRVATGRVTLGGGHADPRGGYRAALEHYDNAGTCAADVCAGADEHGIWLAGALRSTVDEEGLRALRAAPLSGDWRRIGGQLRLMGALAVNLPGFPIPRPKLASVGGVQVSLAAAGVLHRPDPSPEPLTAASVAAEVSAVLRRKARADKLARDVGRTRTDRMAELVASVRGATS